MNFKLLTPCSLSRRHLGTPWDGRVKTNKKKGISNMKPRHTSAVARDSGQTVRREAADNTSHPGRPDLDELVPSRYALRVGEIEVLVVSDGVLTLPGAMLGHNADPAVRAAWLKDMFRPPDVIEWALNVVVVRIGG